MTEAELTQLLLQGEDSRHQFKQAITNGNALAAEMAAFANTQGGKIFVGVKDNGDI